MTEIWTDEQVENLARYQRFSLFHPYTCGTERHRKEWLLRPTRMGWVCTARGCNYIQTFARVGLDFTTEAEARTRARYEQMGLVFK